MLNFSIVVSGRDINSINLSSKVTSLTFSQHMYNQAGECTIMLPKFDKEIPMGSKLTVIINGHNMFVGYLFEESYTEGQLTTLKFYDQLRYWKSSDSFVLKGVGIHEAFIRICKTLHLAHKSYATNSPVLPTLVFDNTTYFAMFEECQDRTFVSRNAMHFVRDEKGVLMLRDVQQNWHNTVKKFVIGDVSASKGFNFSRSIDQDSYNYVKLVNEDTEAKRKDTVYYYNEDSVHQWGKLQYFEKTSDKISSAQLKKRAQDILKVKNRVKKTLSIEIDGNATTVTLKAGDGVILAISDLARSDMFGRAFIIDNLTHKFEGGGYTISLELMLE